MNTNNMKVMREEVSALLTWAESNLRLSPDLLKEGTRECCEMVVACCKSALAAPPRQCDKLSAEECKRIFAKEMTIYLQPDATDNDRTIATLTANGVIDALYATAQTGGYDGSR